MSTHIDPGVGAIVRATSISTASDTARKCQSELCAEERKIEN